MKLETTITPISPDTFEYQTYSNSDENLIIQSELDTVFSSSIDYIEYYIYDQNKDLIYPNETLPLLDYDVREGDVLLNPSSNLESLGFDIGVYNISYSFYRKRAASSISQKYFISSISSDRTEIRLDSNIIENSDIISSVNDFIQYRESSTYFVDFYLNFGQNQTIIANNIKLETEEGVDPTVLIKLYEPLPLEFSNKSELWIVELLSSPQAYKVDFPFEPTIEEDFTYIAGPNYNLNIIGETASPGEQFSYNTLINSDLTSSINQIQSLLNEKEINININYENFGNFVNFSSAKTRLENFYYKVDLIQSSSEQLTNFLDQVATDTTLTNAYSSSVASLTGAIDKIIKNFDGYEYFLYFNSGSSTSYPKSNTEPPFILYPTSNPEVQTWITSSLATAANYDENNRDWLYNSIPEYLRDDPANRNYELFVDMVGQYYDNVWTYTKDITNKFDADNRLDYGISKDLVSDAIKDFAIKLYSNNFNTDDLFTAFLGLTPSGSAFPFPNITGSVVDGGGNLDIPTGYEYVDTKISASNDIVPLDDVNKSIYKRIYHNIPYLLKTKGTIAGLRALITSYGIPDTILRISEFGGKDRNESQDYDLKQDVFNYSFDTGEDSDNFVSSSMVPNTLFPNQDSGNDQVGTVQFRFKSHGIPSAENNIASSDIRYSQSLWLTDRTPLEPTWNDNALGAAVVLEYTGSGFVSGSYSGSIASPYDTWGTLKFYPDIVYSPDVSCSIYAPFFNEDWWSVQLTYNGGGQAGASTVTASLFAANEIDGKIGFSGSDEKLNLDGRSWNRSEHFKINDNANHVINNTTYTPFSGSFQEYRMYTPMISESNFFDYTVNPYSNEGNGINSTPDQQFFRAALGSQLDTGSRTSIHPRVTGSDVQITQSFSNGNSSFYIETTFDPWVTNVEDIFQDQAPVGIKNRITDKIQTEKTILSEAPYGFPNPTASVPEISSLNNDTQTLSPMESMQELSFISQSYTPNVDYLEVAFSPSNQINDDINAQLGYFNLGEFIGDPRFVSSSLYTYPDLDRLRNAYFEKYMDSYDVVDFVRLIKFFDNSLFKMIKDFTPARTSLSSGVVVKQHILERNRQRPAQVTSSLHDYEGLVVNAPKDYSSGSSDFPQYSTQGSSIYKFSGGTGGSFERFNGEQTYGIPLYGQMLGRDGGIPFTGTELEGNIISNSVLQPMNNGTFNGIINGVIKSSGFYPVNKPNSYILGTINLEIKINGGVFTDISVFSTTSNNMLLSPGNTITIPGTSFGQPQGEIVIELTPSVITPSPFWNATLPYNRFGVTQSWQDGNEGSILNTTNFNQSSSQYISGSYLGPRKFTKDNQSEFYDGIFSGSMIIVTTQSLNPDCDPYLNANDTPVVYKPIFFGLPTPNNAGQEAVVTQESFNNQLNSPPSGYAWIASQVTNVGGGGIQQVQTIKLSQNDITGTEVINYLDDFDNLRIIFGDATIPYNETATEYIITGRTLFADHIILQVSQTEGNNYFQTISDSISPIDYYPITSSVSGGSMQWSLTQATDYHTPLVNSGSNDNNQQGVFLNTQENTQEQNFFYYNNNTPLAKDALGFFNPGTQGTTTSKIFGLGFYKNGAYTIPYTPNIPWYIEATIKYSASFNADAEGEITDGGIYHKGTSYIENSTLTNQNFLLENNSTYGFYVSTQDFDSAVLATAASDLTTSDNQIFYSGNNPFYPLSNIISNPALYSDSSLSTPITLISGKYYKVSNLFETNGTDQDYFVIKIANVNGTLKGLLQTGNRRPAIGKAATKSLIVLGETKEYFRPAPRSVSGLGQVLFNGNNYRANIPGNSGSGVPVTTYGGHPKFKVGTTNSMDWSFPKLKIKGTDPGLSGGGTAGLIPFSGSLALFNNSDFDVNFSAFGGGSTNYTDFLEVTQNLSINRKGTGYQYDGSIYVKWNGTNGLATDIYEGASPPGGQQGFDRYSGNTSVEVYATIDANNTFADFKVELIEQIWNGSTTSPIFGLENVLMTRTSTNGVVEFNGDLADLFNTLNGLVRVTGSPTYSRFLWRVQNNDNNSQDYEFQLDEFNCQVKYFQTAQSTTEVSYPYNGGFGEMWRGAYNTPNLRGFQSGDQNQFLAGGSTGNYYSECVVNVYLKRTGSDVNGDYDYIITSSVYDPATGEGGYSGSIHSGSTINFQDDFPVTVFNDNPPSATTMSTYTNPGDMYYVEYEFMDYKPGVLGGIPQLGQFVGFQTSNVSPQETQIDITSTGPGGASGNFDLTPSVLLRTSSLFPSPVDTGTEVFRQSWVVPSQASVSTATVSGIYNGNFSANDIHRFSIEVAKGNNLGSGLVIQEFTASIFPANSMWAPIPDPSSYGNFRAPINTEFIVPTYYAGALPFNLALDCQPLLNNYILQRPSEYIMDVDYTNESGPIIPVNQEQILENKAVKAAVPDSNYTSLRSINPRYDGVKSTSKKLNVWSVGDTGTYGKNPTIELRDAFFGYFNDISDPYPNINALTQVNVNYLIDEQGNALPPSLNDQLSIDTFDAVFPNTTVGKLAIKDGKNRYTSFSAPAPISRTMEYVTPICYSQNSGNNYSTSIPLSGSGYISRYDNNDENSVKFGQFSAAGTSSISNGNPIDQQSVSYRINPTEAITTPAPEVVDVYNIAGHEGTAWYNPDGTLGWNQGVGQELTNQQIVSIQHSVVTTFVSETNGVRDELDLTFKMFTGSNADTQIPFNLEGIDCKVYTETGQVYLLQDVDTYGWFTYENLPTSQILKDRIGSLLGINRWRWSRVPIPGGGIVCKVDWEMFETLFDLGLMRERSPKNGSGVQALEWIFKANSGNYNIKSGDEIRWEFSGSFKDARGGYRQGYFFPNSYEGAYTPAMIKGMGANDYLLDEANKAAAPYWVFSGSNDYSFIEMQSPNFNEAYGTGFYQGDLPYEPGFSEYFPGNVEPKTTSFDKIENPIEFKEGDEIRFGNNESFAYTVLEVFAPSENVNSSGAARVKLRLNRPVDTSINKDFFLVRRKVPSPQSLYLETPFPYGILSSGSVSKTILSTGSVDFALTSSGAAQTGSFPLIDGDGLYTGSISEVEALSTPGILYPDFPTEYLIQSASIIVNDLISKGIIES